MTKTKDPDLKEYFSSKPSRDKWEKVGFKRRAGVLVPLFSVYSSNSLGIGDFYDLRLLADWCAQTGNSIIQLLPMNEVGSTFCPYDSLSLFALEPAYLNLERLLTIDTNSFRPRLEELKNAFPCGKPYLDYNIKEEKIKFLWDLYLKDESINSDDFKSFVSKNQYWLDDFCFFKVLKKYHKGLPWYEWPGEYRNRDKISLEDFFREFKKEIIFQQWLQWKLFQQFKDAREYAASKNVLIKGDLPILASRDSADVWAHPEFFKLQFASGAPPDMYCSKGQRWGTPTYNWEKIALDGYKYLIEKLKYAENFYDILRIDHVVGLFRIWSIPYNDPEENQGLNGVFDPQDEKQWAWQGRKILSLMLENTKMLLCAEDLGVIPKVCTQTLEELGIPGNDVQRWVKDWDKLHDFLPSDEYRLLSVAVLSTHDTTNWPAWWENEAGTVDEGLFRRRCAERGIFYNIIKGKLFDFGLSGRGRLRWLNAVDSTDKLVALLGKEKKEVADFLEFYENSYQEKEKLWKQLGLDGMIKEPCDSNIVSQALRITLQSRSIFCVQLITDWLYLDDIFKGDPYIHRINTPGTVTDKNWSLVIPVSIEKLAAHPVTEKIRDLIALSSRA